MINLTEEKYNGQNINQLARLKVLHIDNVFVHGAKDQRG